jgi:hypothetical protein
LIEKRILTPGEILGIVLGVASMGVAVLALTPQEWSTRLAEWRKELGAEVVLYLVLISGFCLGILVDALSRRFSSKRTVTIISAADYEAKVRTLLDSGKYVVLKNFGYTGKTVWADLLRFEDRYKGIEIRMLHRNWLEEAIEENRHNESIKPSRRWAKSAEIRSFGNQPWGHALKRAIRYYSHHPTSKEQYSANLGVREELLFSLFTIGLSDQQKVVRPLRVQICRC